MRLLHIVTSAAILVTIGSSSAQACSCVGVGPACTEITKEHVQAIFAGKVEAVRAGQPANPADTEAVFGTVQVTFTVAETFKGTASGTVTIRTASSSSACGYHFKTGERYLVYASQRGEEFYTSICSRTMSLAAAGLDLKYLRQWRQMPDVVSIFGEYKKYTFDPSFKPSFQPSIMDHYRPAEDTYHAMAPLTGEVITVISASGERRTAIVDAAGNFSFRDLAPGKYSIVATVPARMAPPSGYAAGLGSFEVVELTPRSCAELVLRTSPDGRIRGRVMDHNGNPIQHVWIRLERKGARQDELGARFTIYEIAEDGSYQTGPLPPGEYILYAEVWDVPQRDQRTPLDTSALHEATRTYLSGDSRQVKS